jgi:dTDP-D-glucose 4,6-dehydratase
MYFDITRATSELGWRPRWSNDEMFIQSYEWYCRNRDQVLAAHGASHHRSAVKQGVLALLGWVL